VLRQEAIDTRSHVHTPRSTLASWARQRPWSRCTKATNFVLDARVLHAGETSVAMLDPGVRIAGEVWNGCEGGVDSLILRFNQEEDPRASRCTATPVACSARQVEFVLAATAPAIAQQLEVWPELRQRAKEARAAVKETL
jgi:hypothetical protein